MTTTTQNPTTDAADDAQEATGAPQTPEAATEVPEAVSTPQDGDEGKSKAAREAARYRTQLRDAEAERDTLAERLATMQRTEAERLAVGAGRLADGSDLWHGAELADLLDDDGNLDAERVTTAVQALMQAKPHYGARRFGGSADGGAQSREQTREVTWQDALKGT